MSSPRLSRVSPLRASRKTQIFRGAVHGFTPSSEGFCGWNGEKDRKIWRPSPSGTERQLKIKHHLLQEDQIHLPLPQAQSCCILAPAQRMSGLSSAPLSIQGNPAPLVGGMKLDKFPLFPQSHRGGAKQGPALSKDSLNVS